MSAVGLGTGGVALAGGLPAPLQEVAADAARAMPFPIAVPYPGSTDPSPPNPEMRRRPEDGEVETRIDVETIEIGVEASGETATTETSAVQRGSEGGEEHIATSHEPTDDRDPPESSHQIEDRSVREGQRADRDRDGGEEGRDREQWGRDRSHHDDRGEGQGRRGIPEREVDDEEEPHEDRWSDDDEWASEDDSWSDDERHDRD
jgi:hypothetical protein